MLEKVDTVLYSHQRTVTKVHDNYIYLGIEITLTGMKKYKRSSNFSFENTIRLSQSTLASMLNILSPPNYVYLIHASYVAKRVKLVLRIDRNVKVYDKKNITIAFDLYRYDLLNDGMLQNPEYYIRPKLNKRGMCLQCCHKIVCKNCIFIIVEFYRILDCCFGCHLARRYSESKNFPNGIFSI